MKRFSKILVAVLALCILVGALALAISANSGVEGNFVVQGKGYATWGEAVAAADNTYTIYLNENLTVDSVIEIAGQDTKVKLDMNGKTLTLADGVTGVFRVNDGASFTITGGGAFDNVSTFLAATQSAKITVDATGSGIVINHRAVEKAAIAISTFRIYDNSGIDISGAITINAINGTRYIFNLTREGDTAPSGSYINVKDAKILAPLATGEKVDGALAAGYTRVFSLNGTTAATFESTDVTVYYGQIFEIQGGGKKNVSAYKNTIAEVKTDGVVTTPADFTWLENAASGVTIGAPTITLVAKNSRFYSDYGSYSVKMNSGVGGHNPGASIMALDARFDGKFDNCSFYADWRPFTSQGSITTKEINQHQLLFTNCHFDNSDGDNNTSQFFIYGMNYKILDSTFAHTSGISAGSNYYLPLKDSDGNLTGKWIGGYMDNTLIDKARTFNHSNVTGGWVDSTYVEANSLKEGAISLIINGKAYKFGAGYFSDSDKYNAYIATGESVLKDYEKYLYGIADGNAVTATGDYTKDGANAATGKYPLPNLVSDKTVYGSGFNVAHATSVLSANGNGYLKYYYDAADTSSNGSSNYAYIQTPSNAEGSIVTNDMFVLEWDISTDDGMFTNTTFTSQGRMKHPVYDKDGNLLGYMNNYGAQGATEYSPNPNLSFNGSTLSFLNKTYTLPTNGEWTRLTLIIDFEVSELKEVDYPVYVDNGRTTTSSSGAVTHYYDRVEGATVKKMAYEVLKYDFHLYINGEYFATNSYDTKKCGLDGYIIEGYEANYYIDGLRIAIRGTANRVDSWCVDNVRSSAYPNSANIDLGCYDQDGKPVASLVGLEHFLVMPDNNVVASVDGEMYSTESEAMAAVKEGSVVELFADFESCYEVNSSFTLITNGHKAPGFVSSTHKVVDYVGGLGYYKLVEADPSDIYTIKYTFNGVTKEQIVAKGTIVPEMDVDFPEIFEKLDVTYVTLLEGWTIPYDVISDYYIEGNVVEAVAQTTRFAPNFVAGNEYFDSLVEAVANANGNTIVFNVDTYTVEALEGVRATTYQTVKASVKENSAVGVNLASGADVTIDFNGATINQNFEGVLFNVTNGTLTLTGNATFNGVGTFVRVTGAESKVVVNATGTGFTVNELVTANGIYNIFVAESSAKLAVSGKVAINNAYSTILFKLTGSDSAEFINADVVNDGPAADQGREYSSFFAFGTGVDVNIESSKLQVNCGSMFNLSGDEKYEISLEGYTPANTTLKDKDNNDVVGKYLYVEDQYLDENGRIKDFYFPEFTNVITANDSELIAHVGAPALAAQTSIGALFNLNSLPVKVVMTNCDLTGNNRVFDGGSRPFDTKKLAPNQFIFTDVNYTEIKNTDTTKNAYSQNIFQENINIIWNGGSLTNYSRGPQFVPALAQNGVIGIHFLNTNVSEGRGLVWTDPQTSVWSTGYYVSYKGVAALVDGNICRTEADAVAAIKDGSTLMILENFENAIVADKSFNIYTSNGYLQTPAIISSAYKVAADGKLIKVSLADESEIFTINYAFGDKTATQTAALGTVISAPASLADRFFDADAKKVVVLKGWTLVDGENVTVVTGNADAIALTGTADPVIVYWTDANGETVLDTDYYVPGEYTTLPDFDGEDIAVDHSADYYGVARTGWAGIENVNLAAAGEYTVTAVMGKISPDTFPGLQYNLTLYAYYVLNLYVPNAIDGVNIKGVGIVNDGSVKFTNMGNGTLEGVPCTRYAYILGAADTSLKSYYIVYTLADGTELSFEMKNIGVPTYAAQAMDKYKDKTDDKSELAKSLIVNMANYADKVLTVTGESKDGAGAKIYTNILANYGDQYLTRYSGLTNDKFLAGGEIYNADGVANLNWITAKDGDATNDDAKNAEAISYLKGISFVFDTYEPMFIMEYSDAAIAVGIQRPDGSQGNTAAHAPGLHAYTGFGSGAQAYTRTWAEDASGKVYNKSYDIWYTGVKNAETGKYEGVNHCDAETYDYFFSGYNYGSLNTNTYWNVHKLKDMSGTFTIRLEIEGNDGGSATGTFEETGDRTVGYVYYNLAAYINSMMDEDGEAEANADFIAAAKALYAFSEAAKAYNPGK